MQSRARDRRVVWIACCVLLAACRSSAGGEAIAGAAAPAGGEATHSLSVSNPTVVEAIPPDLAEPQRQKFVQVELTDVHNPNRIPIAFEVRYRPEVGDEILLGTFSPFPSDNPGRFIVATGGRLRPGGSIAVSLVLLRKIAPSSEIRVGLRISVREE